MLYNAFLVEIGGVIMLLYSVSHAIYAFLVEIGGVIMLLYSVYHAI